MEVVASEAPGTNGMKRRKTEIIEVTNGLTKSDVLNRIARASDGEDDSDDSEEASSEEGTFKPKPTQRNAKKSDDNTQSKPTQKEAKESQKPNRPRANVSGVKRKRPVLEPRGKLVARIEELENRIKELNWDIKQYEARLELYQETVKKQKYNLEMSESINKQLLSRTKME